MPERLDEETVHGVLHNARRRRTLELLEEHGELTLGALAERVAAAETGEDPPPSNARQSVYVSLRQTHLDRLADLGVVAVEDDDEVRVSLGERAEEVFAYMGPLRPFVLSWGEYYAALGALGFLAVVAADVGVPLLETSGAGAVAVTFLSILAVSACYQWLVAGEGRRDV